MCIETHPLFLFQLFQHEIQVKSQVSTDRKSDISSLVILQWFVVHQFIG